MKVKDLIKLIEQDGWFQVAQKGSHRQFKNNLVSQPTADSSSPSGCSPFQNATQKNSLTPSASPFQNATQKNSLTPSAYREFFLGQHKVKTGRVTIAGKLSKDMPIGTLNSILKQAGLKEI